MMNSSVLLLLCVVLSLNISLVRADGYCGDLVSEQRACLDSALSSTTSWHECNYCICQEMGGACGENTLNEILKCEVKIDAGDHELLCRLALKDEWLYGFSAISFVVGSIISFLIYIYYKTANWSCLWDSEGYKYVRSGQCCWDMVSGLCLIYFLSGRWVCDLLNCCKLGCIADCLMKLFSCEFWKSVYDCLPPCRIPAFIMEMCAPQPAFKPSRTAYNPYATNKAPMSMRPQLKV